MTTKPDQRRRRAATAAPSQEDLLAMEGRLVTEGRLCRVTDFPALRRDLAAGGVAAHDAIAAGLGALGWSVSTVIRGRALLYVGPHLGLGNVLIRTYLRPWPGPFDLRPLLHRLHVDDGRCRYGEEPARKLRLGPRAEQASPGVFVPPPAGSRRLELTALPAELAGFAAWLPSWIAARDAGHPTSAPPYAMSREGEVLRYAWSLGAERAMEAWEGLNRGRRMYRHARWSRERAARLASAQASSGGRTEGEPA